MKIPRMETILCGYSVIKGSIIIGWIQAIIYIMCTIAFFVFIFESPDDIQERIEQAFGGPSTTTPPSKYRYEPAEHREELVIQFASALAASIVHILFIVGIKKGNAWTMLPSIIVGGLNLIPIILATIGDVISLFLYGRMFSLIVIAARGICTYLWMVMFSGYLAVWDGKSSKEEVKTLKV